MARSLGFSTLSVLAAVSNGVRHGFDIIDATSLKSGTVYRALSRLEELGLVRSKWEAASIAVREKRPRRKYYLLTPAGERELESARQKFHEFARMSAPADHTGVVRGKTGNA